MKTFDITYCKIGKLSVTADSLEQALTKGNGKKEEIVWEENIKVDEVVEHELTS